MVTERQRRGARAERLVAELLVRAGWTMVARNVRVGRDEVDLLFVDPGPPAELVFVEVRSLSVSAYGTPEERVDGRKVGRLYRSMAALRAIGQLPDGTRLPRLPTRVDLLILDARGARVELRHLRQLMPP